MTRLKAAPSVFVVTLFLLSSSHTFAVERLQLGIFPYLDAASLAGLHAPLRNYLEETLDVVILMRSATSFRAFKENTAEGRFDILLTAPHLGRIADKHDDYRWVGFTRNKSHAVFVVGGESPVTNIDGLKGKTITLPPRRAIIHQMAVRHLRLNGLEPGVDITVKTASSHNNALISVVRGISSAAAFGKPTWDRYVSTGRRPLKQIAVSEDIPGFALLVHPRVSDELFHRIERAALAFDSTPKGRSYFARTGLQGFRAPEEEDLAQLDLYLQAIRDATGQ